MPSTWSDHDVAELRAYLNGRWSQRHAYGIEDVEAMRPALQKADLTRVETLEAIDLLIEEGFAFLPTAVDLVQAVKRWRKRVQADRNAGPLTFHLGPAQPDDPPGTVRYIVEQPDGRRIPAGVRSADELARAGSFEAIDPEAPAQAEPMPDWFREIPTPPWYGTMIVATVIRVGRQRGQEYDDAPHLEPFVLLAERLGLTPDHLDPDGPGFDRARWDRAVAVFERAWREQGEPPPPPPAMMFPARPV
jgi:hypothetical protein